MSRLSAARSTPGGSSGLCLASGDCSTLVVSTAAIFAVSAEALAAAASPLLGGGVSTAALSGAEGSTAMTRLVAVSVAPGGLTAFLVSSCSFCFRISSCSCCAWTSAPWLVWRRPISSRSAAICAAVLTDCSDVDLGAAGLKKNCPVREEFSQGTCLPAVDASTSLRTSTIRSLMVVPSWSM